MKQSTSSACSISSPRRTRSRSSPVLGSSSVNIPGATEYVTRLVVSMSLRPSICLLHAGFRLNNVLELRRFHPARPRDSARCDFLPFHRFIQRLQNLKAIRRVHELAKLQPHLRRACDDRRVYGAIKCHAHLCGTRVASVARFPLAPRFDRLRRFVVGVGDFENLPLAARPRAPVRLATVTET